MCNDGTIHIYMHIRTMVKTLYAETGNKKERKDRENRPEPFNKLKQKETTKLLHIYVCHPCIIMGHMVHNNGYLWYSNNTELIKNRVPTLIRKSYFIKAQSWRSIKRNRFIFEIMEIFILKSFRR